MSPQIPTLLILTTYFHNEDRDDAYQLGMHLYHTLTRPKDDPLAFGAGIPVFCAVNYQVFLKQLKSTPHQRLAERIVVIPVLGRFSFHDETCRGEVIQELKKLQKQFPMGLWSGTRFSEQWRAKLR